MIGLELKYNRHQCNVKPDDTIYPQWLMYKCRSTGVCMIVNVDGNVHYIRNSEDQPWNKVYHIIQLMPDDEIVCFITDDELVLELI